MHATDAQDLSTPSRCMGHESSKCVGGWRCKYLHLFTPLINKPGDNEDAGGTEAQHGIGVTLQVIWPLATHGSHPGPHKGVVAHVDSRHLSFMAAQVRSMTAFLDLVILYAGCFHQWNVLQEIKKSPAMSLTLWMRDCA